SDRWGADSRPGPGRVVVPDARYGVARLHHSQRFASRRSARRSASRLWGTLCGHRSLYAVGSDATGGPAGAHLVHLPDVVGVVRRPTVGGVDRWKPRALWLAVRRHRAADGRQPGGHGITRPGPRSGPGHGRAGNAIVSRDRNLAPDPVSR